MNMKNENGLMINQMSKDDLNALLLETKETLAFDAAAHEIQRTFGAIDMWNLKKKQRSTISKRRLFS
jgi:hypothetical protein